MAAREILHMADNLKVVGLKSMSNLKYQLREEDMRQKSPLFYKKKKTFYVFYSFQTASVEFCIFFSESIKVVLPCKPVPGHGSQSASEAQVILGQYVTQIPANRMAVQAGL